MYSYEECMDESLKYFDGNELAASVFIDKYALRNADGELLEKTPADMHKRIAKEFARIEKKKFKDPLSYEEIYGYLEHFGEIIPQGSPMYGIGNKYQTISLSNCYVLGLEDSYGSILYTDQQLVQISKRRGGIGISLDNLRPEGTVTNNSSRTSTGIISFAKRFSNSIREVGQCLYENNKVLTDNGLKNIKDVNIGDYIWTKNGWIKCINVINSGNKETYKITTKSGYSTISSLDHIYQTFNEDGILTESQLNDLNVGEEIVLCVGEGFNDKHYTTLHDDGYENVNNKPSNCTLPNILDEKLAYILGFSYGNGCVSMDRKKEDVGSLELSCCNDYPEVKEKLKKYVEDVFNYTSNWGDGDGNLEVLTISNKTIVKFLQYNNILKEKSINIEFPQSIIESPISVQSSFISGYFDADGYASGSKRGYAFSSTSLKFLETTQLVLSSLGILSKIHIEERTKDNWNTIYNLCVVGATSQSRFLELMKESYKVQFCRHVSKRDCWITPFKSQSFNIKYNSYQYCPDNNQFLSINTINRLKDDGEDVNTLLVKDTIVSIEKYGDVQCYDLSLEDEHLFWCDGFYVHNCGRRGALMMTLNVHHPQILDFIHCKDDETQVTGANISVCLTDEFLKAVENDEEYELRWPINSDTPQVSKMISAKHVWDEIIKCAHNRAEPGLLFWDNVLRESPADCYSLDGFRTISTNPCSELPLCISDSCRLLVVVIFSCIKNAYAKNAKFDFDKLYKLAYIAQRLMDDMVDLELESITKILKKIDSDPEPDYIKQVEKETWEEIYKKCESGRRTGTGITTVGDTLAACGYEYGSNRGNKFVEKIQKTIKLAAYRCSVDMAKELGAFPIWDSQKEKDNPFLLRIKEEDPSLYEDMQTYGRRNIALLTIAPTGTVSILAGINVNNKWYHNTTSGIEPLFKGWYIRRKKVNHNDKNVRVDFVDKTGDSWMEFPVYHSGLKAWMDLNEIDEINDENQHLSPYYGSCANDIDWTQRVKLQALANKHVDHAISSTINLPNDASIEDVSKIYETAWKTGYCKGMTVYRDGCRSGVIIDKPSKSDTISTEAAERPKVLNCEIHHITARTQPYFVLVGLLDGKPYEVFAGRNGILDDKIKEGQIVKVGRPKCYRLEVDGETLLQPITSACDEEQEALTRMISVCLRHHTPLNFLVDQIEKVQGDMMAFSKAIARVLKKYIPDGTPVDNTCPKCESRNLERQEGCAVCKECGYSACS